MTRAESLTQLEALLESFLERAVGLKEDRLQVLSGTNRLDDLARGIRVGDDLVDDMGGWFAGHSDWLHSGVLTSDDRSKIEELLGEIRRELRVSDESSPAVTKIAGEIERWTQEAREGGHKVVLKRGPEIAPPPSKITGDSIGLFLRQMDSLNALLADSAGRGEHLLSVLDDTLKSATIQRNKDALILSALMIYYLKQNGYLVLPYVERLREAEKIQQGVTRRA